MTRPGSRTTLVNAGVPTLQPADPMQCVSFLAAKRKIATLVIVVTVLGINAKSAHGQILPVGISSESVTEYADALELTKAQRSAMDVAHEQYLELIAELHQSYLAEVGGIGIWVNQMPKERPRLRDLRHYISFRSRVRSRLAVLDTSFFGAVLPLLTERQQVRMTLIRLRRERDLYTNDPWVAEWLSRSMRVDLGVVIDEFVDDLEAKESLVHDVVDFETKLTSICEELWHESARMRLRWLSAIAEDDEDLLDSWSLAAAKVHPAAAKVVGVHQELCTKIEGVFPSSLASEIIDTYYQRCFSSVYSDAKSYLPMLANDIWRVELDQPRREQIGVLLSSYEYAFRKLTEQLVEAFEKRYVATMRIGTEWIRFGDQRARTIEQVELLKRRMALAMSTNKHIGEVLGSDSDHIRYSKRSQPHQGQPARVEEEIGFWPKLEEFIPPEIVAAECQLYIDALGLSGADAIVAQTLYNEYATEYRETLLEAEGTLTKLNIGFASRSTPGDVSTTEIAFSPADEVDAAYVVLDKALAALSKLDTQFLDDLSLVGELEDGTSNTLARLRLSRDWAALTRMPKLLPFTADDDVQEWRTWQKVHARTSRVNLLFVIDQLSLPEETESRLTQIVLEEEDNIRALLQARKESLIDAWQLIMKWISAGRSIEPYDREEIEVLRPVVNQRILQAERRHSELTVYLRELVVRLASLLDESAGDSLQRAFDKTAYPSAFQESDTSLEFCDAVMMLADLSTDQRERMSQAREQHLRVTRGLRDDLVMALRAFDDLQVEGTARREQRREAVAAITLLRAAQRDMSLSFIKKLKRYLTEDQLARVSPES